MEEQTKATETPMGENKTIGRRELLKALAAGGGAVAASAVVSGKWVKPVVEAGVLPAHAATSALIILNFRIPTSGLDVNVEGGGPIAIFDYSDGLGGVTANTVLYVSLQYPNGADVVGAAIYNWSAPFSDLGWIGDGVSGNVTFPLFGFGEFYDCGSIDATIYIQNTDGRTSNELSEFTSDIPC